MEGFCIGQKHSKKENYLYFNATKDCLVGNSTLSAQFASDMEKIGQVSNGKVNGMRVWYEKKNYTHR
jgi:hypothetical protein